MNHVAIVRCQDYDHDRVRRAVSESLDLIGGIGSFVKPGQRVFLKVSLLIKRRPERATNTHPAVARAVAELVREAGGIPIIGDGPGGYHFYTRKTLESVYETCGMTEAARLSGAELNFDTEVADIPYPDGKLIKNVKAIKPIMDAEVVINLPKIKTHSVTVYSGAVKNLFGVIPGSYKAEYHLRFEDVDDFADLLIDLCRFVKPSLTIMDAIVGMEGYGPTGGDPRQLGLVLAGADPFALDLAACSLIGLGPRQVPTVYKSVERSLCPDDASKVSVRGERISDVAVLDFKKPTARLSMNFYNLLLPAFVRKRLGRFLKPKPRFIRAACTGCAMCAQSCPPKAIEMSDHWPVVDLDRCIRCFCCHELCNYGAVQIVRPWFIRLVLH